MKCSKPIDQKQLCPDLIKDGNIDLVEYLMKMDLKKLMDAAQNANKANTNCFGLLPLMSIFSKCQLGAFNAQIFSERINPS